MSRPTLRTALLHLTALATALLTAACKDTTPSTPGAGATTGTGESSSTPAHDVQADWFALFPDGMTQYAFGASVRQFFDKRNVPSEILEDGRLRVGRGDRQEFHQLRPLAEICAALPQAEWPTAITEHFGTLIDVIRDLERRAVPTWETARERLRVRLHPVSFLEESGVTAEQIVCRRDLPGLLTCMVLDGEQSALVVPRADLDDWGRPLDAVFEIAVGNTRAVLAESLSEDIEEFGEFGSLRVSTSESFYAASRVLWMADDPQFLGKHGALVILPWRQAVFAWPFDDVTRVQQVVVGLHGYAGKIADEVLTPLSRQVYWLRPDGEFLRFKFETDDAGQQSIIPPVGFAELLKDD